MGAFALRFFTDYFNIPYPGEKVDLVAIPDFAAGAMENLGCITFRDTALLVDTDEAARAELERVADVIAHELAHMWFGDLVTMGWWEGIWLNEAFATFMEMLCVDAFRPSWDRWVGFAPSREAALAVDAVHSTRPIEYPVGPPKEAEGMFDLLTYEKGCGVLRMLEQHIGADVFRDGVRTYLKAHAYGNTVTTDLWDALEDASGAPVRDVMNTFILQGGHPLVSLHGDHAHPAAVRARARRRRAPRRPSGPSGRCPLAVRALPAAGTPGAPMRHLVLGARPDADRGGRRRGWPWSTPAAGACSGSATRPSTGWRWPSTCAELTPLERANLLADTWATTLAGRTALREFLVLASRLGLEPDPAPWAPVGGALVLTNRIAPAGARGRAARGRRRADRPHPSPPGLRRRARGERPHAVAARARHQPHGHRRRRRRGARRGGPALRRLADRRRLGRADPRRHRDGRRWPWSPSCVRPGDYDALLERYRSASTPQEEMRSLGALAGFPDVDLCLRTFDLAMTEVRSQNGFVVIGALLANPVGNQAVWDRVTENWDAMLDRFPKNAPPRILETMPALCADADFAERAIAFLDEHPLTSGPRRVAQSVERLRVNVAFAARERAGLADSLAGGQHAHLLMARAPGAGGETRTRCRPSSRRRAAPAASCPTTRGRRCSAPPSGPGRRRSPAPSPTTFVEIGAWCGKSTVYLGAAAEATGAVLLSIDHHRGSEENQPGWEYHEPDLVDPEAGRIDTLPHWRRTIAGAGLEASVVGIVGDSPTVAARWDRPLAFCFIDGGHGEEPAWADFRGWAPHVAVGGWLAIHDVFPDPADGGRPPYELYCAALDSGEFVDDGACGSLRVLRRVAAARRLSLSRAVRARSRPASTRSDRCRSATVQPSVASPQCGSARSSGGGQALAAEQPGRRRGARQRVGGQHHGGEGVGRPLVAWGRSPRSG